VAVQGAVARQNSTRPQYPVRECQHTITLTTGARSRATSRAGLPGSGDIGAPGPGQSREDVDLSDSSSTRQKGKAARRSGNVYVKTIKLGTKRTGRRRKRWTTEEK